MMLRPLDIPTVRANTTLPESFRKLEVRGFHRDLLDRAYAHLGWVGREGKERHMNNASAFLSVVGKGFLSPFDRLKFEADWPDDGLADLRRRALDAICELSQEFGDRVSSVVWDSLAHLAVREDPEATRSILKEAHSLPHHFGIVDTMLHAVGKVYTFLLRVQSVFCQHTGMVLIHNCDCNCSLLNLGRVDGRIEFGRMSPAGIIEASQSLFTHMCAESHLILDERLPFEYSITAEAPLVLGLQQ